MTSPIDGGEVHLKDLEIAAYLDRGLEPEQVERIEEHLTRCLDCRENVIKTRELVARERGPRRLIQGGLFLAAAAVVLLVALPSLRSRSGDKSDNVTRSNHANATTIVAYGPIGEVGQPVRFVWGAVTDALSYRLTLNSPNGSEVWTASVADTIATLPRDVRLQSEITYVWVVDAILKNGGTRSTGLHEFGLMK